MVTYCGTIVMYGQLKMIAKLAKAYSNGRRIGMLDDIVDGFFVK